jgi:hypothetical protein
MQPITRDQRKLPSLGPERLDAVVDMTGFREWGPKGIGYNVAAL